ncbi:MAG: sigma-70 family RNA polymerase sigma factor [Planctomycetes bacterium]|nr:sigma-70 family RNA polymerase sigma factor [Planctomycetota bacterium]
MLLRIRDAGDNQAWSQFAEIYAPLIFGFARRRGLQTHDAADLTQEVLAVVARAVRDLEYDPKRGAFRGWLFTVFHRKFLNFIAAQRRHPQGSGDTGMLNLLHEQPAPAETEEWDRSHEQRLFAWASDKVRQRVEERTWQAFCQTAVAGKPNRAVAEELGMTVAGVRLAKSRVMAQIRKLIQALEAP